MKPRGGFIGYSVSPAFYVGAGGVWDIREAESLKRESRWSGGDIVSDTFTGSNNTSLSSRSPDILQTGATGWANQFGTAVINTNQASFNSFDYYSPFEANIGIVTVNANISNCVVRSIIKWGDNGSGWGYGGIIIRYQDSNNFLVLVSEGVTTNCAKWAVFQVQSGSASLLVDSQSQGSCLGALAGQTGQIQITMNGSNITAQFAANSTTTFTHVLSCSSSVGLSATRYGLFTASAHSNARFDDFSVRSL
jgi:hypothetical protein